MCIECPAGTFQDESISTTWNGCKNCPGGKTTKLAKQDVCVDSCVAGEYYVGVLNSGELHCSNCAVGQFTDGSVANPEACDDCSPGKYEDDVRSTFCKSCPSGRYGSTSKLKSLDECELCGLGLYNPGKKKTTAADCLACGAGTYQANKGESTCTSCGKGTFLSDDGTGGIELHNNKEDCQLCGAGTFFASTGASVCTNCPTGTYLGDDENDVVGRHDEESDCRICGAGKYSESTGAISEATCLECPRGTWNDDGVEAEGINQGTLASKHSSVTDDCQECEGGKYNDVSGASTESQCKDCPKGTYNPNLSLLGGVGHDDVSDCRSCGLGKFLGDVGADSAAACKDCPVGTYNKRTAADGASLHDELSDCTSCPAGTFNPSEGQSVEEACNKCVAGQFRAEPRSSTCEDCARGLYSANLGQVKCTQCPRGTFTPEKGNSELNQCSLCPMGYFGHALGAEDCSPCAVGLVGNVSGGTSMDSSCPACAAGKTTSDTGKAECTNCTVGFFLPKWHVGVESWCLSCDKAKKTGSTTCDACPGGYFGFFTGRSLTPCGACPKGQYAPGGQAVGCEDKCEIGCNPCPKGRYSEGGDKVKCESCPKGFYQENATVDGENFHKNLKCHACSAGRYSDASEATTRTVCQACGVGRYSMRLGATLASEHCLDCPAGLYGVMDVAGHVRECESCARGSWSNDRARTTPCTPCVVGRYAENEKETSECKTCDEGTYSNDEGAARCKDCPAGQRQGGTGSKGCNACDPGKYAEVPGQISCVFCPAGFQQSKSNAVACIPCMPGHRSLTMGSLDCDACTEGRFAPQLGTNTTCMSCPTGYYSSSMSGITMALCFACPTGFYQGSQRKAECDECGRETFSAQQGQEECSWCPVGWTTSSSGGMSSCQMCVPGKYGSAEASQSTNMDERCQDCVAGQFRAAADITPEACKECESGRYMDLPGMTSCNDCLPGQKQPVQGQQSCTECDAGTYMNDAGSANSLCKRCGIGKTTTNKGSILCLDCPSGSAGYGCKTCPSGWKRGRQDDSTECLRCQAGFYTNKTESSSCLECAAGAYASNDASTQCNLCKQGQARIYNQNPIKCYDCEAGRHQAGIGQASCLACTAGRFSDQEGEQSCTACPSGWKRGGQDLSTTACVRCQPGYYTKSEGQASCLACSVGLFTDQESAQSCEACPSGWKRSDEDLPTACVDCQPGYYAKNRGSPFCLMCDVGTYAANKGLSSCHRCSADTYTDEKRQVRCKKCVGKFDGMLPNNASTLCEQPPWKIPTDCKTGSQFLNDSAADKMSWTCDDCPVGADCDPRRLPPRLSVSFPHLSGFWNVPWKDKLDPVFVKCPFEKSCLGSSSSQLNSRRLLGNGSTATGCTNTTTGVLCAVCPSGYYRENRGAAGCRKCRENETELRTAVLLSVAMFLFLLIWCLRKRLMRLRRKYIHTWRDVIRLMAINLSYIQINSALPIVIDIPWPQVYLQFLEQFRWVNVDLVSLLGMRCIGGDFWDFRARIFVACMVPVLWTILILLLYRCKLQGEQRKLRNASKEIVHTALSKALTFLFDGIDLDQDGSIDDIEFPRLLRSIRYKKKLSGDQLGQLMRDLGGTLVNEKDAHGRTVAVMRITKMNFIQAGIAGKFDDTLGKKWLRATETDRIWSEYMAAMMVVLFLMHAPVSQRLFYFFACVNVGDRYFLQTDYSLECWTGSHLAFAPFVALYMMIFTIYFPLSILWQLFRRRKHLRAPRIMRRYGFLYANFNVGGEFWELHEIFRKVALTGLLVFIQISHHRATVAIIVCMLSLALLNYVRPHISRTVFWCEELAFVLTCFKFLVPLIEAGEQGRRGGDDENSLMGWILISLDVTFAVGSVVLLVALVCLMGSHVKEDSHHTTSTSSSGGVAIVPKKVLGSDAPPMKLRLRRVSSFRPDLLTKAAHLSEANKTQERHAQSSLLHQKKNDERHANSQNRLKLRLQKRASSTNTMNAHSPTPSKRIDGLFGRIGHLFGRLRSHKSYDNIDIDNDELLFANRQPGTAVKTAVTPRPVAETGKLWLRKNGREKVRSLLLRAENKELSLADPESRCILIPSKVSSLLTKCNRAPVSEEQLHSMIASVLTVTNVLAWVFDDEAQRKSKVKKAAEKNDDDLLDNLLDEHEETDRDSKAKQKKAKANQKQAQKKVTIEKTRIIMKSKIGSLQRLEDAFAKLDLDSNGVLSKKEFGRLVSMILQKSSKKMLNLLWEAVWDLDSDGVLSNGELNASKNELNAPFLGAWLCLDGAPASRKEAATKIQALSRGRAARETKAKKRADDAAAKKRAAARKEAKTMETKNGNDKVLVQEKGAAPSPVEDLVESARLIVQKKTGSKEKLKMIFGKLTSDSSVGMTEQEFYKFIKVTHKQALEAAPAEEVLDQLWKSAKRFVGMTAVALDAGSLQTWLFEAKLLSSVSSGKSSSDNAGVEVQVNGVNGGNNFYGSDPPGVRKKNKVKVKAVNGRSTLL